MIAAVCLFVPPLLFLLIHRRWERQERNRLDNATWYFGYTVISNVVMWILLRLFFSHGDQMIYYLNHDQSFAVKYFALMLVLAVLFAFAIHGSKRILHAREARQVMQGDQTSGKKRHRAMPVRIVCFAVIAALLFGTVNAVVQPVWTERNRADSMQGFYEEPENTIETIFLGSSHVYFGFSAMELYDKYGICSYNLGTDSQPLLASYYWLEEAYRLHAETLDTVVLDVSMLRTAPKNAHYHEAFDHMRFSGVKLRGIWAYSGSFTKFLWNLMPVFNYHDRWKELTGEDIENLWYEPDLSARGYPFRTSQWISWVSDFSVPATPLRVLDETAESTALDETELRYFQEIVSFCEEKDMTLVLVKTPTAWSSADHNAVQEVADEYGLAFFDFNIDPYYSEIGFDLAADVLNISNPNNLHANYYGMSKMTNFVGEYLIEECGNRDVRGEEKYAFMEEELEGYQRYIALADFEQYTDPCDYIDDALRRGDYTIFLSVNGEASDALTEEQRAYFASIGLDQLSELSHQDSYLAVIENGVVEEEQRYRADSGSQDEPDALLKYSGTLPDGTEYTISSKGTQKNNTSSITIGGKEQAKDGTGLHIVLYDNCREEVIDSANFDTGMASERANQNLAARLESELNAGMTLSELDEPDRTLYLYHRRCENEKNVALAHKAAGDTDLFVYLDAFLGDPDLKISLSVRGDADEMLDEEMFTELAERGLSVSTATVGKENEIRVVIYDRVTEQFIDRASFSLW